MRKDVKIGLAIAGVLFAVLIVYAFVPKKDGNQDQYSAGDGQQQVDEGNATDGTGTSPDAGQADPGAGQQDSAPADGDNKDAFATDANTADPARTSADAGTTGSTTDWLKTIETGSVVGLESHPPLIAQTQTPTAPGTGIGTGRTQTPPAGGGTSGQSGTGAADAAGTPAIPAVGESIGGNTGNGAGRPAQRNTGAPVGSNETPIGGGNSRIIAEPAPPGPGGGGPQQRTHVIQRNETLSSIAKAVYGKQSYYLQIQKANPNIDPNRLRPGTTINLPDISATIDASTPAKPAVGRPAGSQRDASSPAVNPQTEYRIQPGDSLYRISVKLYGDGGHVDELYENNARTIGDDPARLKVGTVLKLHDAPRVKPAR